MRWEHGGAATPVMFVGDYPRAVAKAVGERLVLPVGAKGWEGTSELAGSDLKTCRIRPKAPYRVYRSFASPVCSLCDL